MTKHLRKTIEIISTLLPNTENILEIGSRQELNQRKIANLRNIFLYKKYVGLDIRKGPGVDIVANGENLPFKNKTYSLIICLETLEHTKHPWLVTSEITRVLKNSGTVIVSSQQNFPLHKHPNDYFRYTPYGLSMIFEELKDKLIMNISPPFSNELKTNPQLVLLIGWKKPMYNLKRKLKNELIKNTKIISGHKPYRHRMRDFFKFQQRSLAELVFRQEILFINTNT